MSFFGSKPDPAQAMIEDFHLQGLNSQDQEIVREIANDLISNNALTVNMRFFGGGNTAEFITATNLNAAVKQNWLIINQLSRIESLLQKIAEK